MNPIIKDLDTLAKKAGEILRAGYNKKHQIDYKGAIDLVTEIDRQSEEFLLDAILTQFPNHHILAEEKGVVNEGGDHVWYIDPLDGTVNYAHNIPIFCVSIGYAYRGALQLATVYDPMRDELFSAVKGEGARLNGKPIHISAAKELGESLLTTGFPYEMWETKNDNLDDYGRFAKRTQGVRRLGAAALDLCYVGAGRFDGYWERLLKPWDLAAGGLIAREAGAIVTKINGDPNYLEAPFTILAAPPAVYEKMSELLNE